MSEGTPASDARELRPRVKAALEFLDHCRRIEQPYESQWDKRELTARERATCDAALDMLNRYFLGEIDIGDSPLCESARADPEPLPIEVAAAEATPATDADSTNS